MKDKLLVEIHKLASYIDHLMTEYDATDIRVSFFEYIYTIFSFYYQNLCFSEDKEAFLKAHKEISQKPNLTYQDLLRLDIVRLFENSNNSKMLLDSWSMFELAITLLSDRFVPLSEKDEILRKNYTEVRKIFQQLDNIEDDKLKKKLIKKHFTLSSINEKYNKLFNLIASNYATRRDLKADKVFLDNLGCLRNGIHSNYIYFGNPREPFTFKGLTVTYENGKTIKFDFNGGNVSNDVILNLVLELSEIFKCIIDSIGNRNCIENPALNLYDIGQGERN